jgi:hypothetical protein
MKFLLEGLPLRLLNGIQLFEMLTKGCEIFNEGFPLSHFMIIEISGIKGDIVVMLLPHERDSFLEFFAMMKQ